MLEGPKVWLDARAYSVMALVLHELCTNAAKYGSLSKAGGKLSIAWSLMSEGGCRIEWHESGGPIVSPPKREGFGTLLIARSIPYDLGGESRVDYLPTGVEGSFFIPQKHILFVTAPGTDPRAQPTPAEVRSPSTFPARACCSSATRPRSRRSARC